MGLFDHLFKSKTDPAAEEQVEAEAAGETTPRAPEALNVPQPKPPTIPPPGSFATRSLGQVVTPGRGALPPRTAPIERQGGASGAEKTRSLEIVLTLGDVLARIPAELLIESEHDKSRPLRFAIDDLSADIARGRAAVPLSQIAAQCPDIFRVPIDEDNDLPIRLPLQKLVEQIAPGAAPSNPTRVPAGGSAGAPADAKILLSIAAILRTCPREIIVGELPPVGDTERIVFPFAPIERQLPSGRVDVSSIRFVAALPLHMHEHFRAIEGVRVPLPLDEIFQNLPGVPAAVPSPAPPPAAEIPALTPAPAGAPAPVFVSKSGTPAPPATEPAPPLTTAPPTVSPMETVLESVASPAVPFAPEPMPGTEESPAAEPEPALEPAPEDRVAEPLPVETVEAANPPAAPVLVPRIDSAKDEIAELRARIAALKVEFSVPSVAPEAAPPAELPSPHETAALIESLQPLIEPSGAETPPPGDIPVVPAPPAAPPAPFVPSGPHTTAPPPSGPPPVTMPPRVSEPALAVAPAPLPPPAPELFRPPLVPPPVAPVVITTPKIEPPAPVMLPVRIVAPPPVRPHVAPPRLFSAGENVPLTEVHAPAPEPPVPPPPPPPPPLALEPALTLLGIEGEPALARVAAHLAALPGLGACVLDVRHESADAGTFSEGSDATGVRALAASLAGALAGREDEHITVFGEGGSISIFARGGARLAVLHRARVFLPGVRETLAAATAALAQA